jgi:broad specificity phosphatase PhoE
VPGEILFVGHGAVGTLLLCHVAGIEISRTHDQPNGGGCYFTFAKDAGLLHHWRRMETPPAI